MAKQSNEAQRPRIHISITVDEDFFEAFSEAVDDCNCTKAEIVEEALGDWLRDREYLD